MILDRRKEKFVVRMEFQSLPLYSPLSPSYVFDAPQNINFLLNVVYTLKSNSKVFIVKFFFIF